VSRPRPSLAWLWRPCRQEGLAPGQCQPSEDSAPAAPTGPGAARRLCRMAESLSLSPIRVSLSLSEPESEALSGSRQWHSLRPGQQNWRAGFSGVEQGFRGDASHETYKEANLRRAASCCLPEPGVGPACSSSRRRLHAWVLWCPVRPSRASVVACTAAPVALAR